MTHISIFILQVKMIDFWIRLIEFFHQLYITVIILSAGSCLVYLKEEECWWQAFISSAWEVKFIKYLYSSHSEHSGS